VRHDGYARAKPLQVEKLKSPSERGKYLAPDEHGFPATKGVHCERTYRLQQEDEEIILASPTKTRKRNGVARTHDIHGPLRKDRDATAPYRKGDAP
jgi:hypothetical protein